MYADTGGDGPVVVLLHGVLMNGSLWTEIVDDLRDKYRCIVPELPLGGHRRPMPAEADLTLPDLAKLLAEFPSQTGRPAPFRRSRSPAMCRPRRQRPEPWHPQLRYRSVHAKPQ